MEQCPSSKGNSHSASQKVQSFYMA